MPRQVLALVLLATLACVDAPKRSDASSQSQPAAGDPTPAEAPAAAPSPAPAPAPAKAGPLTPEELELLAADPKTLTPEQNRKRGYALRKKIMQNPESPEAKTLEETRQAVLAGEIPQEQIQPTAQGQGSGQDSGLVIELPEHLKEK